MSSRNKKTRERQPDKMNNVFFRFQGQLYCLHQWDLANDFTLTEVRPKETPILYSGPMDNLPSCIAKLVQDGVVEQPMKHPVMMHYIMSGNETKGWLHTHGMADIGLPELEMRGVPSMLQEDAASVLRQVCAYMQQDGVVVRLGETMGPSPRCRFRFVQAVPIPGEESHYEVERWQLAEIDLPCDSCRLTKAELN